MVKNLGKISDTYNAYYGSDEVINEPEDFVVGGGFMMFLKYYLFGCGRPCSHYIPSRRRRKSKIKEKAERLTVVDCFGNWQLKGVRWCDLYVGMEITRDVHEKIYAALQKLLMYEDTGLSPEEVEHLKDELEN